MSAFALHHMNVSQIPKRAEFYFRRPDNLILVENGERGVVIRATHDNFSPLRKSLFIRELASEGFIPDHFQWFSENDGADSAGLGVHWIIDSSWVRVHPSQQRRVALRILLIYIIASTSWLAIMALALKLAGAHFNF